LYIFGSPTLIADFEIFGLKKWKTINFLKMLSFWATKWAQHCLSEKWSYNRICAAKYWPTYKKRRLDNLCPYLSVYPRLWSTTTLLARPPKQTPFPWFSFLVASIALPSTGSCFDLFWSRRFANGLCAIFKNNYYIKFYKQQNYHILYVRYFC